MVELEFGWDETLRVAAVLFDFESISTQLSALCGQQRGRTIQNVVVNVDRAAGRLARGLKKTQRETSRTRANLQNPRPAASGMC
jgi:hypothetical protein